MMDHRAFLSATGFHFRRQFARSKRREIEINLINEVPGDGQKQFC